MAFPGERVVCRCERPLIANTAHALDIDGVEVDNRPPLCIRCYVRERETRPQLVKATP